MDSFYTLPRLYVKDRIETGTLIVLVDDPFHYLKNVRRLKIGSQVRVFNGIIGEFLADIDAIDKKSMTLKVGIQIRTQTADSRRLHVLFPPLKKEAQDILIEKCTELGATDFHPVLTAQADVRTLNVERVCLQIIQAVEQCERLDLPRLHTLFPLDQVLAHWPTEVKIVAAIERMSAEPLARLPRQHGDQALLIGPAGGWRNDEKNTLKSQPCVIPVDLGPFILRAETAAIALLAYLQFNCIDL